MVLRAKRNHEVSDFMPERRRASEILAAEASGLALSKPNLRDGGAPESGFAVAKRYALFTETLDRAGKA